MNARVVVKIEGSHGKGGNNQTGNLEERSQTGIAQNTRDKRRTEEEEQRHATDEKKLQFFRLVFDDGHFPLFLFENFGQVLAHGRRNAVANENNNHRGERYDHCVATVIGRPKDAPHPAVNDVAGQVVEHFADKQEKKRSR